ncbi:MAG: hypothetical protein LRY38_02975, partial [Aeromonadaceae bacterium]|nr:hypothetical protein [Aeromonadaceae bacterium]
MQARVFEESWPIAGRFVISRGARTEARVVVVELTDGTAVGRGECVPYARYGETVEGVMRRSPNCCRPWSWASAGRR